MMNEETKGIHLCAVCGGDCGDAHNCNVCGKHVHPFCGKAKEEDEGYGGKMICKNCLPCDEDFGE